MSLLKRFMSKSRRMRKIILFLMVISLPLILVSPKTKAAGGALPNIVLILADDLGYGDCTLYGSSAANTPNIQSIADNGVLFTEGYEAAPVCSPSRAGIMTSLIPGRMGIENNEEGKYYVNNIPNDRTIAAILKDKGYDTAVIGKWNMGDSDTPSTKPSARGFDEFFGFYPGKNSYYRKNAPSDAVHLDENGNVLIGGTLQVSAGQTIYRNDTEVIEDTYLTQAFTREALSYIDSKAGGSSPFFLYLAYNAPHYPLQVPKSYYDKYSSISDPQKRIYAAMIDVMDKGIGDVINKLKAKNIYDNTIIVFLSDNGPAAMGSAGDLKGGKYTVYEGGIKVPFAIQWPEKYPMGKVYSKPVSALDIYPTLAVASGYTQSYLDSTFNIDGDDLSPYLSMPGMVDDFGDGNYNGWTTYDGNWNVINGKLNFSNSSTKGNIIFDNSDMDNFTFEADIKVTSGIPGMIFSASSITNGPNSYYGYRAVLNYNTNELDLIRVDNGSQTTIGTAAMTITSGNTYHMKVTRIGNSIKVYVNNMANPKISVTDSNYTSGKVGFTAMGLSTDADFDNVDLRKQVLPVTQGAPTPLSFWRYLDLNPTTNITSIKEAVKDGGYKYIKINPNDGINPITEELYNLTNDPNETTNLVNNSNYATIYQNLKGLLSYWEDDMYPMNVDDTVPYISYTGANWTTSYITGDYGGGITSAETAGHYLQYTFTGSNVKLYARKGPGGGKVDVYLDGNLVVDNYDLYSDVRIFQTLVFDSGTIASGSHTIKYQVTGLKNASSTGYHCNFDYISYSD